MQGQNDYRFIFWLQNYYFVLSKLNIGMQLFHLLHCVGAYGCGHLIVSSYKLTFMSRVSRSAKWPILTIVASVVTPRLAAEEKIDVRIIIH